MAMGGGTVFPTAGALQQEADGPAGHGIGPLRQDGDFDDKPVRGPSGQGGGLGGLCVQIIVVGTQSARGGGQVFHCFGIDLPQQGHDLAAQEIAGIRLVAVGGILHMGHLMDGTIFLHLSPGGTQQGAHHV